MAPAARKHASGTAVRRRCRKRAPPTAALLVRGEVMAIAYARERSADLLESLATGVKRRHVHLAHELTTVSAQDPHLGSSVKKPDSERSEFV